MSALQQQLHETLSAAFAAAVTSLSDDAASVLPIDPLIQGSQHAHFQANAAMALAKRLKLKPRDIATQVVESLSGKPEFSALEVAGPGFINITVSDQVLTDTLSSQLSSERLGADAGVSATVVVDYSAPNVAKEMHVGHLRSTIIGDACVRLFEWQGHTVLRRNHIGDWGTPFGMLIEHLTDIGEDRATEELSLGDLNTFYRAAREKFEASEDFQTRARGRVVKLQSDDAETLRLWKLLIDQSQSYFVSVYKRLNVRLDGTEFFGESAYNDMLKPTLDELTEKGLIESSDGADCLYPKGFVNRDKQPLPLIVRKSDGGYGYAATDLSAIRNRIIDLNTARILYVVGAPQKQHLDMVFEGARMAGWLNEPVTAEHISFGSVLGADGKMFKSRTGETIKLADLLDESVRRARSVIDEKNADLPEDEKTQVAESVGIGAVKYADLSSERTRDYVFDFDQMLALEGNTAPYLQYAHARICSILRQAKDDYDSAGVLMTDDAERQLALQLLRFPDVIADVTKSLLFHRLATWLYETASAYSTFYTRCPVLKTEDKDIRQSRLRLCKMTATSLETGLQLLGIDAPQRM